ncbi:SRPBCC domain-containing protein [Leifsonia sp. C5G2]|uniref:SRPBCC family protein n=1 Tax=Leifsonia sp. C5G2 TaxID=2735269 RepID=UPI00158589A1|nr:SRPBCC domain-containing protein [Leifsonia sp. C5G2]NUU05252.1 SRPBCC domain-containing protein [Leifsonia sp. C5G2]
MRLGDAPIHIDRVFDAPRALVYRAFTDPDQLAAWWGPIGNSIDRDEMDFDVRPGGHQRWVERVASDPEARIHVHIELIDVRADELIDGVMHVSGTRRDGFAPFESRFVVEFHDEGLRRTRLDIRQWLPADLARPAEKGWLEAFQTLEQEVSKWED